MNPSLRPMEATWLLMESDDAGMHVGALMVFALPDDAAADVAYRLHAALRSAPVAGEPWQVCLARGASGWRRWQRDESFDIDYHVRHVPLPAPGGERELGMAVERLHSAPLDLRRAPWECHLLSGLHGNRYALYFKVHPALTEATAIVQMLVNTLADQPDDTLRAPWSSPVAGWRRGGDDDSSGDDRPRGFAQIRPLAAAFGRLLRAGGSRAPDLRAPYTAPHLALQVRTGPQRRVATQQYDRARLAAVAQAFGASEGELVLYLCATALRRFFREYNALPLDDSLVAALPGQHDSTSMGLVNLGTQHADPHRRLQAIQASLRASREHLKALPRDVLPAYTFLATSAYLVGQVTRLGAGPFPMFNLLVSSSYGPESPRWLGSARLEALYPLFPLLRNNALTFDCMRYDGKLHVAVVGARDEVPRLQRLAVYMGQALADLEDMLRHGEQHAAGATR
jgi:diacylglycerol O-acyltransferase